MNNYPNDPTTGHYPPPGYGPPSQPGYPPQGYPQQPMPPNYPPQQPIQPVLLPHERFWRWLTGKLSAPPHSYRPPIVYPQPPQPMHYAPPPPPVHYQQQRLPMVSPYRYSVPYPPQLPMHPPQSQQIWLPNPKQVIHAGQHVIHAGQQVVHAGHKISQNKIVRFVGFSMLKHYLGPVGHAITAYQAVSFVRKHTKPAKHHQPANHHQPASHHPHVKQQHKPAKQQQSGLDTFNKNIKKVNKGLRKAERGVKWLNKPLPGAKRGMKY